MYPDKEIIARAKILRRNPTEVEKILWSILRNHQSGCKFRRQHPVGQYVVDFFCQEKSLVIELDGGQHSEEKDAQRTGFLHSKGYVVLRFWNDEVYKNKQGVYQKITEYLQRPSPQPSPEGRGG